MIFLSDRNEREAELIQSMKMNRTCSVLRRGQGKIRGYGG